MSRPLSIAVVGHVRHPIARPFMGGIEAHSWHLVHALAARGHDVTLFASGDSVADVAIRPILAEHYDRRFPWERFHGTAELNARLDAGYAGILGALGSGRFDVVHNNSLHRFPPRLSRRDRVPMVSSLHVPPFDVLRRAVHDSAAPWHGFTVTSAAQRRLWWPDGAPGLARIVPNGIALSAWPFVAAGDGGAVWSGRIMPLKGAHLAIAAARRAGMPLRLFGAIEDRGYFEERIRPELGPGVAYGGHLDQRALAREIGRAAVFLFTPLWDEPFGLAAAEAMACGVPIAGLDRGAVREVVGPGGVIAGTEDADGLAAAIAGAIRIPRRTPREWCEGRYALAAMVDGYERLYAEAIAAAGEAFPPVDFPPVKLPARCDDGARRARGAVGIRRDRVT